MIIVLKYSVEYKVFVVLGLKIPLYRSGKSAAIVVKITNIFPFLFYSFCFLNFVVSIANFPHYSSALFLFSVFYFYALFF